MTTISLLRRITKWIAYSIAAAIFAGALYQAVMTLADEANYPPPGQIINVDGRGVHLNCTGEGSPTIILESGLDGGTLDWGLVQPAITKFGRVCSYDRSGIAWSESGETPRNADRVVTELHRLLETARIDPPFVLAGHSIGGVYVQLFAVRYPNEVKGVVLIDSSHQDQLSRIPGIPGFVPYAIKAAAPIGVVRLVHSIEDVPRRVPPEMKAQRAAIYSSIRSAFTNADEMAAIPDSLASLRASPLQLGNKPLIILSRGKSDGSPPDIESKWRELQTDLLKLSSSGKQVIAEQSGHYIHFSEPELVIDSIREITSIARTP